MQHWKIELLKNTKISKNSNAGSPIGALIYGNNYYRADHEQFGVMAEAVTISDCIMMAARNLRLMYRLTRFDSKQKQEIDHALDVIMEAMEEAGRKGSTVNES